MKEVMGGTTNITVNKELMLNLITLWRAYQLERPTSAYNKQSFTGFISWLESKYWLHNES